MPKFCKKSDALVIDALRYTGVNAEKEAALERFAGQSLEVRPFCNVLCMVIPTPEGEHLSFPGDWIIRHATGELSTSQPHLFAQDYQPA